MELEQENLESLPQNAEEAESLLQQWESQDAPEQGATAEVPVAEQAVITPKLEKYVIKRGGKEVELELTPEKRLNLLQQGYDYSENQRQIRLEREAVAKERQAIEARKQDLERLKQYQEVENYTKQDPQWWEHVRAEYARRLQEQGGNAASLPPAIMEKIDGVTEFVSQLKEERTNEARAKEDGELDSVITDYRTKHADLDWSATDAQGRDLERQIIDHALEMGISKPQGFVAAANNYLFDKHIERAKLGAKTEVGKTIQKQAKLGLGPVTEKRTLAKAPVKNVASKSYEELTALAIAELGGE